VTCSRPRQEPLDPAAVFIEAYHYKDPHGVRALLAPRVSGRGPFSSTETTVGPFHCGHAPMSDRRVGPSRGSEIACFQR
jgi:hypothetical protein